MAFNHDNSVNEEQVASFLEDALKRINEVSEDDIQALNAIKKLYKKNIPWSRRQYVTAYLVKQALQGKGSRFGRNDRQDRFNSRDKRNESRSERNAERSFKNENTKAERKHESAERAASTEQHAEKAPRVHIDPSMATTIFIGIGRNRRVYPRDLVGLLVSVAGLDRERIGDIRVLANYSFIQLFTEDCEKTINALNGYDYRGRKLSVSYSKQKEEGDAEEAAPVEENTKVEAAVENVAAETPVVEEKIPETVTNDSFGVAEASEEDKIAKEQMAFAASQTAAPAEEQPYSETTDDGQVKSHFGNGAAY